MASAPLGHLRQLGPSHWGFDQIKSGSLVSLFSLVSLNSCFIYVVLAFSVRMFCCIYANQKRHDFRSLFKAMINASWRSLVFLPCLEAIGFVESLQFSSWVSSIRPATKFEPSFALQFVNSCPLITPDLFKEFDWDAASTTTFKLYKYLLLIHAQSSDSMLPKQQLVLCGLLLPWIRYSRFNRWISQSNRCCRGLLDYSTSLFGTVYYCCSKIVCKADFYSWWSPRGAPRAWAQAILMLDSLGGAGGSVSVFVFFLLGGHLIPFILETSGFLCGSVRETSRMASRFRPSTSLSSK